MVASKQVYPVEKKVKACYLDIKMNNIFVDIAQPNEAMPPNDDINKMLGRLEEGMKNVRDDIGEIKADFKNFKQLEYMLNQPKHGMIARWDTLEADVKEIKNYIENQKRYIALISTAAGIGVTAVGFALKQAFLHFFK